MPESDIRHHEPHRLGLLLIDGFALMSYASIIEPFRAANALAGRPLYQWAHITLKGVPAVASNEARLLADDSVAGSRSYDTVFVIAGGDPARFSDAATFSWLRRLARQDVRLAGVSGGPYLLAKAGLLDGRRATIHWEHRTAFADSFPDVRLTRGLYVIDRRRLTCAGGFAAFDLAVELIGREHGRHLSTQVSDWFIGANRREADDSQRSAPSERYGTKNRHVLETLVLMENAIEEPIERLKLTTSAALSVRQLERLFMQQLGLTINQAYLRIRLAHAIHLLKTTTWSVIEVGIASGFKSSSHFSRSFSCRYGHSPLAYRQLADNFDMTGSVQKGEPSLRKAEANWRIHGNRRHSV